MKKKIFVLGTGRSGTHWLGNILDSSSEIKIHIERKPIFKWVTASALDKGKREKLMPFIIWYYKIFAAITKKHFADKSHPNLWLVDDLYEKIQNSYFIGIIREPHATVSSMLLHGGVLKWINNWEKYPVPNEFLGITEENQKEYQLMSIEEKCVLRWIAHNNKLDEIQSKYKDRFLMINYETLFENPISQIERIVSFLDLKMDIPTPKVKIHSKEKWKEELTNDQINIINSTLIKHQLSDFVKSHTT